jgi:hypothetical protein
MGSAERTVLWWIFAHIRISAYYASPQLNHLHSPFYFLIIILCHSLLKRDPSLIFPTCWESLIKEGQGGEDD